MLYKFGTVFLFFFQLFLKPSVCAQPIEIKSNSDAIFFEIDTANRTIKNAQNKAVLFTISGNMAFAGQSDKKEDIVFLLNGNNLFSRKGGYLKLGSQNITYLSFAKGKFYLGESVWNQNRFVGAFEITEQDKIVFRLGEDSIVLFETQASVPPIYLVSILAHYVAQLKIDEGLLAVERSSGPDFSSGKGSIRKLWDSGQTTFLWDGVVLKSKWTYNDYEQWTFDGQVVQRKWYETGDDWVWDGEKLQSRWNTGTNVFIKEGNSLRALYGNSNEEYFIQGNLIKRAWTQSEKEEWEINGEIPIPLVMMIVFKIIR